MSRDAGAKGQGSRNAGFHVARDERIKAGAVTDVYFVRDVQVLKARAVDKVVKGEVRAASLPDGWDWAVFAGLEEAGHLLSGLPVEVEAMPEGTVFGPEHPVLAVKGVYSDFAVYETALLGLLCQASGIATRAARCRLAAGDKTVYSFGARRMHPAIAPMIERNAFIGGCDGVSVTESAKLIGEDPVGTMPHALIIAIGSEEEAFKAFDQIVDPSVRRIALVDTFSDEKFGALKAAEALGEKLFGVRLDTPSSRRGDFVKIVQEVRWELDLRGFNDVKIVVSGGLGEEEITRLEPHVDGYGVGTYISNSPVIDFSFDLMEVDDKPAAKRGKMSGSKQVWRCSGPECIESVMTPAGREPSGRACHGSWRPLIHPFIRAGEIIAGGPSAKEIRSYVLDQLRYVRYVPPCPPA